MDNRIANSGLNKEIKNGNKEIKEFEFLELILIPLIFLQEDNILNMLRVWEHINRLYFSKMILLA